MRSLGPMTADAVIARARSAIGLGTVYRLGEGGRDPFAAGPGNPCDCSGFAAWGLGVDRYLPNGMIPHLPGGDWLETGNVYRDALSPYGFASMVAFRDARPADVLVFPDEAGRQGHIGIISNVAEGGVRRVIHCSLGNWNLYHDAIQETGAEIFLKHGAIAARIAWVN